MRHVPFAVANLLPTCGDKFYPHVAKLIPVPVPAGVR